MVIESLCSMKNSISSIFVLFFVGVTNYMFAQVTGKSDYKTIEFNSNTQIVEKTLPPLLEIASNDQGSPEIKYTDPNQNNRLDANETFTLSFKITNKGQGMAKNVKVTVANNSPEIKGITFDQTKQIAIIPSGGSEIVNINLKSSIELVSGVLNLGISFYEPMGFSPDPLDVKINTKEFARPNVTIVDQRVISESGSVQKKKPVTLTALVQNIGQGTAEDVKVNFVLPENVFPSSELNYTFPKLISNEQQQINFEFLINDRYASNTVPIKITISEKFGRFAQGKTHNVTIDSKTDKQIVSIASNATDQTTVITQGSLTSDVDKDFPENTNKNSVRYALIIGNEDYTSKQPGLSSESNVAFAVNDARIFKEYALKTMGIPEQNITLLTDATTGQMKQEIVRYTKIIEGLKGKAEFVFYYAGHGLPDEASRIPYIMPTDVSFNNLSDAINLIDFYKKISDANPVKATIFLDACFSGGGRDAGLYAAAGARAVKIKPKTEEISGNIVVFAATSEDQSALPYKDKKHGMFTYHILKALQEYKGDITYGQLEDFLNEKVNVTSLTINRKEQNPSILTGTSARETWENWKIK